MSTTHRLLVAAVLTGVGLATAACAGNGAGAGSPATETVTVEQPAESDSPADPGAADHVGSQLPASFPDKDFPIPPGVRVIESQEPGEKGIVLTGMAPDEVAAFYRSALPAAGYDITKDASVGVGGVQVVGLEFTGQGYNGKLAVVSSAVAISLVEQ
jgi:hypothetical protein